MISALSSSISGMKAAFKMLDVSAHNTANLNTDGFKGQRVNLTENAVGGVNATVETSTNPGPLYLAGNGTITEGSNTDLATEIVNRMLATHYLSANMATLKTIDEMQNTLLDIIA
jgi:flagellar basal-body rod protein FlgC